MDWQAFHALRLLSPEGEKPLFKVHRIPCQPHGIPEPEPREEAEKNNRLPFVIRRRCHKCRHFPRREWFAFLLVACRKVHRLARVRVDRALPPRPIECRANDFQIIAHGGSPHDFQSRVPEGFHVPSTHRRKWQACPLAETLQEGILRAFVSEPGMHRLGKLLACKPVCEKLPDGFPFDFTSDPGRFQNAIAKVPCRSFGQGAPVRVLNKRQSRFHEFPGVFNWHGGLVGMNGIQASERFKTCASRLCGHLVRRARRDKPPFPG